MRSCDLPEEEIIKCFHCGNETPMPKVGEYSWGSRDEEFSDFDFFYKYELFACPVCHKVTLREIYSDETMIGYFDRYQVRCDETNRILFPLNTIDSASVPGAIKKSYDAALKIKCIDEYACLMSIRRTLELILKDNGATKWGLSDKIKEAAKKELLPDTLMEALEWIKQLGDTAAHDKKLEVDQYDVENMIEFVGFIIKYLYIMPDKMKKYKKHFKRKLDAMPKE